MKKKLSTKSKSKKIKSLVVDMLKQSNKAMTDKVDNLLKSGAIDIDNWDESNAPMVLPKCIVMALFDQEISQYSGRGTGFEKQIKKQIRNIRYFL